MKFSITDFFGWCDQIRRKLRIWTHLLKKSLMKNFIFCAVRQANFVGNKAKGRISKRVLQENKARQIFRKTNIFYPLIRTGGKKCSFFGKFGVFCFLETPVLRFALLPYYQRFKWINWLRFPLKSSGNRRKPLLTLYSIFSQSIIYYF